MNIYDSIKRLNERLTELETLIEMMGKLPDEVLPIYKAVLRKQIVKIKEELDEKDLKILIDSWFQLNLCAKY